MSKILIPYYEEAKGYIPEVSKQLGAEHQIKSISLVAAEKTSDKNINDIVASIDWADIIVVMIFPGIEAFTCINRVISHAERSGKQIIGVYVGEASQDNLPQGLKNFGQGCVSLDEEISIKQMLGNPSEIIWQDSDGNTLVLEEMDRFTC